MIGVPFEDNDLTCLGAITEIVAKKVAEGDPEIDKLAAQFVSTDALAAHIRSLPQRDDEGIPDDGPKVDACTPWQRLRFFPPDPNCLERTAYYMILAEKIDPWPVRRMATLDFAWGRHTFPVEEGAPVVLDPRATYEELIQAVPPEEREPTRNARRLHEISRSRTRVPSTSRRLFPAGAPGFAGLPPAAPPPAAAAPMEMPLSEFPPGEMPPWAVPPGAVPPWAVPPGAVPPGAVPPGAVPPGAVPPWAMPPWAAPTGMPIAIDVLDALNFTNMLAQQGAISFRNGPSQAYRARNAIQDIVSHGIAPTEPRMLDAIGWFFSIAEKIARSYGARALTIVRTTALAVSDLIDDILAQRQSGARNLSFESGGRTFQVPSWLSGVGALAGKIGLNIGALALAPKLAALGITGPMLELVEQELNAEGLSLGPLANPRRSFASALSSLASKRTE